MGDAVGEVGDVGVGFWGDFDGGVGGLEESGVAGWLGGEEEGGGSGGFGQGELEFREEGG